MDCKDFLSNLNENLMSRPKNELKSQNLISEVNSGNIKFLCLVESIQGVLLNEDVGVRECGIDFLSWVLTEISTNLFNGSEVSVIVNFYCDCLKGHHNTLPATIKGLLAIVKMKHIAKDEIIKILAELFQHVNCRTQLQADRYNIYSILKFVIECHLNNIKIMGLDLVFGLISFIEGETDPLCLYVIFNFLPSFIKEFDLSHLSEELFEVLSCYFPIDFNSAAQDNTIVTREDLAEGLLHCLTGNAIFCEQCLPIIFEKLDSSFKTAKLDSYKLLQTCCKYLTIRNIENHLDQIWKSIQKDVLPGNDKEICEAGLRALTSVVELLSKESYEQSLIKFLSAIIETVKTLATRVDENMFQPVMRILMAASANSERATTEVLNFLKPFYKIGDAKAPLEFKIILSNLIPLLKYCHVYKVRHSENSEICSSYSDLINLFIDSAKNDEFEVRKLAFLGILQIVPDLGEEPRKKLYQVIMENIIMRNDIKTCEHLLTILRELAQLHPLELHNLLFSSLNITYETIEPSTAQFLWTLSLLADIPCFTESVVPVLLKLIVTNSNYVVGLESLLASCKGATKSNSVDFYPKLHVEYNALKKLIFWWLQFTSDKGCLEEKIIITLGELLALITRNQSLNEQQKIISQFIPLFIKDSLSDSFEFENLPNENILKEFSPGIQYSVVLFEGVLGSLRPDVTIPNLEVIQQNLVSLALTSKQDLIRLSSSRLLASLINKSSDTLAFNMIERVTEEIFKKLENPLENSYQLNAAIVFTWIIKGIVLRGGSFEEYLLKWFDLLARDGIGEVVAEEFRIVFEDDDLYLNLESHCNIRVLYRQRLFGYFPKLLKMFESSRESVKINYLMALVQLIQGVPKHLFQQEISSVVILLIRCLDTNKAEVLLIALDILIELLESREKILGDHINSFIPKFLRLASYDGSMKIRINSLKCLFLYAFYSTITVLPLKNKVIHDLQFCLDDKKRLVRKEAVRARCRWFLVGAPGEDILQC